MTTVHKIRLGEQTQGDIVDLGTLETDATLVLAPDGAGGVEFRAEAGGSPSTCDHEHGRARFVAAGATPETFTVDGVPLWGVTVTVQGLEADPADVTLAGSDVSLNTIADQVIRIHYEAECGTLGTPLTFPGVDETHNVIGTPEQMNVLGSIVTTGPAYAVIRGTDDTDEFAIGTDSFPGTGLDIEYAFGPGFSNSPQAGNVYMFRLQNATTYWIGANFGAYSGGYSGSGSYKVYYPTAVGTVALTFPGASHSFAAATWNRIATITVAGPTAMFVTFDSPLPAGYLVYVISDDQTWQFFLDPGAGQAPPGGVDPIPAGTYAFMLDPQDEMPGDWHILIGDGVAYDGGLTNTGTYETHLP